MEKFGANFFNHNPTTFATADCAYVLSYAVIMLQTAIHNP
jgi:brefeldin A-inhibited guanine nucleotide-exchange protein